VDFSLSEDLQAMQTHVREFVRHEIAPQAAERDRNPAFPRDTLRQMGELGLLGILTPESFGGAGLGTLAYAVLLEEVAAADASVATIMSVTNGLPQQLLVQYGSEDQKRRYLRSLATGAWIGAFCL